MSRLYLSETQQFELSAEALVSLAEFAASNAKYEPDLLKALYELGIPSVTRAITEHVDLEDVPTDMAASLWDAASPEDRYHMIDTSVLQNLTKKQMEDIIADDYARTLRYVARNFEDTESSRHISKVDRKKFLEFLRRHADKDVREALANNDNIAELLEKWGLDFSLEERLVLNALSVDLLKKHKASAIMQCEPLSSDNLEWLSEHIDELEKQIKKRKALAQQVIDSKDPKFRQSMAKSSFMPRDILQMLAEGEDPVAARYARITLAEQGEDEEDEDE